jgi:hypothetical protein
MEFLLESEAIRELQLYDSDAYKDAVAKAARVERDALLCRIYLDRVCPVTFSLPEPAARKTLDACLVLQVHIAKCRLVCKRWAEAGLESLKLNLEVIRDFPSEGRHKNIFRRCERSETVRWDPESALNMHRRIRLRKGVLLIKD